VHAVKRIVFATFGSLGDIYPYIAVALELKRRGHHPVIATSDVHRTAIEAERIDYAPMRPHAADLGDSAELVGKLLHPTQGPRYLIRDIMMPHVRGAYEDLDRACSGADVLVTHPLAFAGRLDCIQEFVNLVATSDICGEDIYFDLNLSTMRNADAAALGVAFSQQQVMSTSPRDAARRTLLGRLVTCGHCTSDEARALANWVEIPVDAAPPIPGDPRAYRWLDIKAVLRADGAAALKAYLGLGTIRSPFVFPPRPSQAERS